MWRTYSLEKTLMLKTGGEGDDRGWDGWMASLTQWTRVWVNSGSWWWRPGVLRIMGSQRVGHDWATELNSYVEHLFMCLLAICISFLEKCLFRCSSHFSFGFFVFCCCWVVWDAYIFCKLSACWLYCLTIFSLILWVVFCLWFPLLCKTWRVPFVYFHCYFFCLGRLTWENMGTIYVRECFAYDLF